MAAHSAGRIVKCQNPGLHGSAGLSNPLRWVQFASLIASSRQKVQVLSLRRRSSVKVIAAAPPAEAVAVASTPLTKEQLVNHLRSGCKPPARFRIGTEHEKFGFNLKTLRPLDYDDIALLLNTLASRFGWDRILEGDKVIGLKRDGQVVSLEAGGQLEFSGAPVATVDDTQAEIDGHLHRVKSVAEELGIGFLGLGANPKTPLIQVPVMPKERYAIIQNYMPKVGTRGLDMLSRTCSVQVNLDFESEEDMVKKMRVGLALQPLAMALFANSPFFEGKLTRYLSFRGHIWEHTDPNRTGDLPFAFEDGFGFERYVDYALQVPMYLVYRNKCYTDAAGMSFQDFISGRLPALPGQYATLADWDLHLGTLYPEVRLKQYMEMRGADCGDRRSLTAVPAFWVGLMYDRESLDAAYALISDWTAAERAALRNKVPQEALRTPFRDGLLMHVAQDVVKLAKEGLKRRGFQEERYIEDLERAARTGICPADRLLELYDTKWGHNVDAIFADMLF